MSTSIDDIKTRVMVGTILSYYGSHSNDQGQWNCPFPERHTNGDVHPSVTIKDDHATCWSQRCFDGADIFQLVGLKEGLTSFPEQKRRVLELAGLTTPGQGLGKIVATYDYTDETGELLFQCVRYLPKDFRQRRPDGHGGVIWDLNETELVLYHLLEVLRANHTLTLEGEKDVETAYQLGLPDGWAATCNPMGAGKWREAYSDTLAGKVVVILPDADTPGQKHGEQVARSLQEKAAAIFVLALPDGAHDLSEWAEGKTGVDLAALLTGNSIQAYRPDPLPESNFHPLAATDLLAQHIEAPSWILEEFLPAGALVLWAGKPKIGKSTVLYELCVHVAQGYPFLGRATRQGAVLVLAIEERLQDVQLRLQHLGADHLSNLYVHVGPSELSPTTLTQMSAFIRTHNILLVVIDTLSNFWRVQNENDASEVTKAVRPLLDLAHTTNACVLLNHHARKSEGSHGDEIRGSSAAFAMVDVAIVMKRHSGETQRLLQSQSRYPETPSELVIELQGSAYVAMGDPSMVGRQERLIKLLAALTNNWEDSEVIRKRAELSSRRDGNRLLEILVKEGTAKRKGKGVKGDPFRYSKMLFGQGWGL
ncbi:MAG: AAA family ATPase [Nitrospirales bacterium]